MTMLSARRGLAAVTCLLFWSLWSGTALAADPGVQQTFAHPIADVQKAAASALAVVGCTIKKDEPGLLEGYRDRKVGVFVGSGGETVTVTLTADGDAATKVDVRTKKTFVGGAGQKNWNKPVIDEITKALAGPAATPDAPAATTSDAPAPASH